MATSKPRGPGPNPETLIVEREFKALLERCAAAGLKRQDAEGELFQLLWGRSLKRAAKQKKREAAPFEAILRKAYECAARKDAEGHQKACEEWLFAKHGVKRGDVVLVYGWTPEREILIDRVTLSGHMVWFDGPTSHIANGRPTEHQGCSMDCSIQPTEPSARLRARYPERFPAQWQHAAPKPPAGRAAS